MLGAALRAGGHRVAGASPRCPTPAAARAADAAARACRCADVAEVVAGAELVLLAVPDDVLARPRPRPRGGRRFAAGQIVVHTSGAHGVAVLDARRRAPRAAAGPAPGDDVHRPREDLARLAGAASASRAPTRRLRPVAEALVVEMGADPVWVAEEVRPLYHAALAHGANHLVTLVRDCVTCCEARGRRTGRAGWSRPLLSAALDNALRLGDRPSPGRWPAATSVPSRTHLRGARRRDPDRPDLRGAGPRAPPDRAVGRRAALRATPRARGAAASTHPRQDQPSTDVTAPTRPRRVRRGELTVHATPPRIAAVTRALRAAGRRVALVLTMGALHEGHRELIRHARAARRATSSW